MREVKGVPFASHFTDAFSAEIPATVRGADKDKAVPSGAEMPLTLWVPFRETSTKSKPERTFCACTPVPSTRSPPLSTQFFRAFFWASPSVAVSKSSMMSTAKFSITLWDSGNVSRSKKKTEVFSDKFIPARYCTCAGCSLRTPTATVSGERASTGTCF